MRAHVFDILCQLQPLLFSRGQHCVAQLLPGDTVVVVHDIEINALVRGSTLIVQKSLREGFGLTVSEALWKRKPVIATNAGGLPLQVIDGATGVLVGSVEETAGRIRTLLRDPQRMERLGDAGGLHVHSNFLITTNACRWLRLLTAHAASASPDRGLRVP
jgi:trehalose synthase